MSAARPENAALAAPAEGAALAPPPLWSVLVGLGMPVVLVVMSALVVPAGAGRFLGISASSWCLFACAPLTTLALALCWRCGGAGGHDDSEDAGTVVDDGGLAS